jgi:hypothetical protein
MGKNRFHFDIKTNSYLREIPIHLDNKEIIIYIRIPKECWCRKTSCAVNQWIRRAKQNNYKNIDSNSFRWGDIKINSQESTSSNNLPSIPSIDCYSATSLPLRHPSGNPGSPFSPPTRGRSGVEPPADGWSNHIIDDIEDKYLLNEGENNHPPKTDISIAETNIIINKQKYKCDKCKKIYYTRSGLSRHRDNCIIEDGTIIITQNQSSPSINGGTNIIINNNINNIQIRNYGDENPKWLTSNLLYNAVRDIKRAVPKLMQKRHFNDDFPENKNLRINTKRDMNRLLQVFENGRWRLKDRKQTFYRVIVDIYDILSEALRDDNNEEEEDTGYLENTTLNEQVKKTRRSHKFLQEIEKIRPIWEEFEEKIKSEDNTIMDDLWNDLKILLMDRHLAIEQGFE